MAISKYATFHKFGKEYPIGPKERGWLEKRVAIERGHTSRLLHGPTRDRYIQGVKAEQMKIALRVVLREVFPLEKSLHTIVLTTISGVISGAIVLFF